MTRPLPPGLYSVVRWRPFLRAAATAEGLAAYPAELRPVVLRLRADYALFARQPAIEDLSTPSMRGSLLSGQTR